MKKSTFHSKSSSETVEFGKRLAKILNPGDIVGLIGDLGAGKTLLAKGILQGLGLSPNSPVTSPTYSLIKTYDTTIPVAHIDLYRLNSNEEIFDLDFDTTLDRDTMVLVIEWYDRILDSGCLNSIKDAYEINLFKPCVLINISSNENGRTIVSYTNFKDKHPKQL